MPLDSVQLASGIYIPRTAAHSHECGICGAKLYRDEYMTHMKRCTRRHEDELQGMAAQRRRRENLIPVDQEAVDFQLKRYGAR